MCTHLIDYEMNKFRNCLARYSPMAEWLLDLCNSSARAIRKTALRAHCGCRHRFTHLQALSS